MEVRRGHVKHLGSTPTGVQDVGCEGVREGATWRHNFSFLNHAQECRGTAEGGGRAPPAQRNIGKCLQID